MPSRAPPLSDSKSACCGYSLDFSRGGVLGSILPRSSGLVVCPPSIKSGFLWISCPWLPPCRQFLVPRNNPRHFPSTFLKLPSSLASCREQQAATLELRNANIDLGERERPISVTQHSCQRLARAAGVGSRLGPLIRPPHPCQTVAHATRYGATYVQPNQRGLCQETTETRRRPNYLAPEQDKPIDAFGILTTSINQLD